MKPREIKITLSMLRAAWDFISLVRRNLPWIRRKTNELGKRIFPGKGKGSPKT